MYTCPNCYVDYDEAAICCGKPAVHTVVTLSEHLENQGVETFFTTPYALMDEEHKLVEE